MFMFFGLKLYYQGRMSTLKVIGAGLHRTGTVSTKAALEELGFTPVYHSILTLPPDCRIRAVASGQVIDNEELYQRNLLWNHINEHSDVPGNLERIFNPVPFCK